MLNRFAFEKLGGSGFGVASSGLIFVMPMSPRFSVICYDGLVYSLDVTNGRVVLKSEAAVDDEKRKLLIDLIRDEVAKEALSEKPRRESLRWLSCDADSE